MIEDEHPNQPVAAVRHEAMRIAGKRVETDQVIEVFNPYNGAVVGTVPPARPEHVREAFAKAKGLQAEAHALRAPADPAAHRRSARRRKEEFARLITAESGLCWKDSLYEAGRAYDVYSFAGQLTIKDDGETYACDISPQGKQRKIFTTRYPLAASSRRSRRSITRSTWCRTRSRPRSRPTTAWCSSRPS
jgi:acyl-CoA reductase-like NAD-dependent aldehyde dehydrogenase